MLRLDNPAAHGAALLRVSLGVMFLAHGLLKILVFTPAGSAAFFESVGFPAWTAYLVIAAETGGGLLLIAGAWVRLVSLALIPVLIGAAAVHWGNGWVFSAPNGGWEYPVFLIAATAAQALMGAGAFALKVPALPGLSKALAA